MLYKIEQVELLSSNRSSLLHQSIPNSPTPLPILLTSDRNTTSSSPTSPIFAFMPSPAIGQLVSQGAMMMIDGRQGEPSRQMDDTDELTQPLSSPTTISSIMSDSPEIIHQFVTALFDYFSRLYFLLLARVSFQRT